MQLTKSKIFLVGLLAFIVGVGIASFAPTDLVKNDLWWFVGAGLSWVSAILLRRRSIQLGSLVALFLFLAWNFRKYQKMVVLALGAGVLSRGITEAIRFLWDRPRPYIENHVHLLINKVNAASFPSAHAAFFFGISLILYLYNKKAGLVFFGASILIAIARVFVAVHYPSDILAGISVGIISAIVIIKIFKVK